MRKKWPWLLAALLLICAGAFAGYSLYMPGASPVAPSPALAAASEGLPQHTIDAVFSQDAGTLSCTHQIDFVNTTGETLDAVYLRTFANAFWNMETSPANTMELYAKTYGEDVFSPGGLSFSSVQVNGQTAQWALENDDKTAMRITLTAPLPAGASVRISLKYTITIPECAYPFGRQGNVVALGYAFPSIADFAEGAWLLEAYPPAGAPSRTARANWRVDLSLPDGWRALSSGEDALAVSSYGLALAKNMHTASAKVGGTVVSVTAASRAEARNALQTAARIVNWYDAQYGAYPWPSLSLVRMDIPFGSASFAGLSLVKDFSVETMAHTIAGQWFLHAAGSDPSLEPWLSESLSAYAALCYQAQGQPEGWLLQTRHQQLEAAMRITLPRSSTIGARAELLGGWDEHTLVTRLRGAAMMIDLSEAMGQASLDAALRAYLERAWLKTASRADFEAAFGDAFVPFLTDYLDTPIQAY